MSDQQTERPWEQQGWAGTREAIDAARAALHGDPRIGGMVPIYDPENPAATPPKRLFDDGPLQWGFGVAVLAAHYPLPCPEGCHKAADDMAPVAMGGAGF